MSQPTGEAVIRVLRKFGIAQEETPRVKRFIQKLTILSEAYGVELSPVKVVAYYLTVADIPEAEVEAAMNTALRALKYFPSPAELREQIEGNINDRAYVAYSTLLRATKEHGYYASVKFEDPLIMTVVEHMGGWMEWCQLTAKEQSYRKQEFVSLYRFFATKDGIKPPHHLIGFEEASNSDMFPELVPPVVMVKTFERREGVNDGRGEHTRLEGKKLNSPEGDSLQTLRAADTQRSIKIPGKHP